MEVVPSSGLSITVEQLLIFGAVAVVAILMIVGILGNLRSRKRNLRMVDNYTQRDDVQRTFSSAPPMPVAPTPPPAPLPMVDGENMDASAPELTLEIQNATVEVRHDPTVDAIKWSTNYPDHFTAGKGYFEQTDYRAFSFRRYQGDHLVITVPEKFSGGLKIRVSNDCSIDVDHWSQGDVTIEHEGSGKITIGDLLDTTALYLMLKSDGDVELGNIVGWGSEFHLESSGDVTTGDMKIAGVVDVNLSDTGDLTVGDVESGEGVNVSQTSDGKFISKNVKSGGDFGLKVEGYGSAEVGDIDANGLVELRDLSDGDLTAGDIKGGEVKVGTGDDYNSGDNADVTIGSIAAEHDVDVLVSGERDLTITNGIVSKQGDCTVKCVSYGDADIGGIEAHDVSAETESEGNMNLGNISASGKVTTNQTSSGDVTIGDLKAQNFDGTVEDEGALNIGDSTIGVRFSAVTNGYGDVDARSVTSHELRLETTAEGNITVRGGTAEISVRQSGDGSIDLASSFGDI